MTYSRQNPYFSKCLPNPSNMGLPYAFWIPFPLISTLLTLFPAHWYSFCSLSIYVNILLIFPRRSPWTNEPWPFPCHAYYFSLALSLLYYLLYPFNFISTFMFMHTCLFLPLPTRGCGIYPFYSLLYSLNMPVLYTEDHYLAIGNGSIDALVWNLLILF